MKLCFELGSAWKGFRGTAFDNNYIFIDKTDGSRMCIDCPGNKFRELIDMYNTQHAASESEKLPQIRLHDLRHTFATNLVNGHEEPDGSMKSLPVKTVADLLGHTTSCITEKYYVRRDNSKLIGSTDDFLL